MNRHTIIGFVTLIILIGGLFLYFGLSPSPDEGPGSSSVLDNPYTEETDAYVIAANYPTTTPLSGGAGEAAVDTIQGWIIGTISEFKEMDFGTPPEDMRASLTIRYLISSSPRTVSYIFTIDEFTGGAHPMQNFHTFTFDTTSGEELALANLFVPGSDYLSRVSALTRTTLTANLGEAGNTETINAGTEPASENFQNFFIDNATLVFLYPPYAVAAYAAGSQTVQIPMSAVADILKPEYRP